MAENKQNNKEFDLHKTLREIRIGKVISSCENNSILSEALGLELHASEPYEKKRDFLERDSIKFKCLLGTYNMSKLQISEATLRANRLVDTIVSFIKQEGGYTELHEKIKKMTSLEELYLFLNNNLPRNLDFEIDSYIKDYILIYAAHTYLGANFDFYKNNYLSSGQFKDIAQVMLASYARIFLIARLGRCCRMRLMNAPDVIQAKDLQLLTRALIEYENISTIEDYEENFSSIFGINMDGKENEDKGSVYDIEQILFHNEQLY